VTPTSVYVDRGNGGYAVDSLEDLWRAMWAAVACGIFMSRNAGRCRCGCDRMPCAYCIGECFEDVGADELVNNR
jgi:hypothetical protein